MSPDLDRLVDTSCPEFTIRFLMSNMDGKDVYWDCCRGNRELREVDVKLLETSGFMSEIYRLTFTFEKTDAKGDSLPFTAIFKVPSTGKLEKAIAYNEQDLLVCKKCLFEMHKAEVRFYEEVFPLLSNKLSTFIVPHVYATRLPKSLTDLSGAFILMQELRSDTADDITSLQVKSAIRAVAQLHALSLSLPEGLVDSFDFKADVDIVDDHLHVSERLLAIPEQEYADYFKENKTLILNAIKRYGIFGVDHHKKFGTRPVLCHGDFWQSNMFFQREVDGSIGDKINALFDWQVTYAGTGVNDVCRLIFVGVDPELRRKHLNKWLDYYHSCLTAEIEKNGLPVENPYKDIGVVQKIFEFHRHYEMIFVLFLCVNILGGLKDEAARMKLLVRMKALFEDQKHLYA